MENEAVEVNETEDHVMSFTEEEANKIRQTVDRIKKEVAEELEKSKANEEKTQGRSR